VTGYDTAGWGDLLACAGGAAAALAGLIFVGLSVNMSTLLDLDQKRGQNFLTGRALEALVAMLNILVICIVTLTPHILKGALAAFVLLTAVASAISPVRALRAASREERRSPTMLQRIVFRLRPHPLPARMRYYPGRWPRRRPVLAPGRFRHRHRRGVRELLGAPRRGPVLNPVSLGDIGAVPGAALIFVSAKLKAALNGIWEPLLGFSEESLSPDFDGFALAHGVDKPFPPWFVMDTADSEVRR
jgi:hypothetical protein